MGTIWELFTAAASMARNAGTMLACKIPRKITRPSSRVRMVFNFIIPNSSRSAKMLALFTQYSFFAAVVQVTK